MNLNDLNTLSKSKLLQKYQRKTVDSACFGVINCYHWVIDSTIVSLIYPSLLFYEPRAIECLFDHSNRDRDYCYSHVFAILSCPRSKNIY